VAQINGVVGQMIGGSGSSSNSTSFMTIADLGHLQVQAQVNESDMAGVKPGSAVTFTVSAYPGTGFTGHVMSVQPLASQSQNVVTYTALCSAAPKDTRLLPGMTASLTVVTDSRRDAVLVPANALQFAQSQGAPPGTVLVMTDGAPTRRPVQTGLSDGRMTEAVSGLQPGEIVITGQTGT